MVEHPEPNRQEQTSRSGSRRGWAHRRVLVAAALTVLVGAAAPALAHVVQVEPVVMEIKGRESYLTAEFKGNIQDILQAVQITDQERQGTG
ncbi:MAG: hypothetical protein FJX77_10765, partial [Armatimonadetes bacterium]|nr:hypothetical protein [Armatimonadota bacterium]